MSFNKQPCLKGCKGTSFLYYINQTPIINIVSLSFIPMDYLNNSFNVSFNIKQKINTFLNNKAC